MSLKINVFKIPVAPYVFNIIHSGLMSNHLLGYTGTSKFDPSYAVKN